MCDKCQELEKKIERYRRLASLINDQLTVDRFNQLIKDTKPRRTDFTQSNNAKAA